MNAFTTLEGIVAPIDQPNVDTDQIIPKQFLKRVERSGYEDGLFFDWRFAEDGKTLNPDFELNAERYAGACILLARENFGCGSSREHAPWALENYGFRCILAPSYADIFYNNCFNNGMLPIVLAPDVVDELFEGLRAQDGYALRVDLPKQEITKPDGTTLAFEIDPFLKERLVKGLDQIGLTLQHEGRIAHYESLQR